MGQPPLDGENPPDVRPEVPGGAVLVLRRGGTRVRLGEVARGGRCGLGFVDDLLRLQLALGRFGWQLEVVDVPPEVAELFELVGLTPGRRTR